MRRISELRRHLTHTDVAEAGLSSVATAAAATGVPSAAASRKYRYTLDSPAGQAPVLTPAQRDFYEEHGYLVVRRLVSPLELERYHARFVELCDGKVDRPMAMTVMRDGTGWGQE